MEKSTTEQTRIVKIMSETMEKIKSIVDVNTIIGEKSKIDENTTIVPIAKISVGFVSGGGEYNQTKTKYNMNYPMTGGTGTGYSVKPVGLLVCAKNETVKYIPVDDKENVRVLIDGVLNLVKNLSAK